MSESDDNSCPSHELLANELLKYCESDTISEEGIHEIIQSHKESTSDNYLHVSDYEFFHQACYNEKVTEGIIRCLLEYFPAAVNYPDGDWRLPLHSACENSNVSIGSIQLLIDAAPDSVGHADPYEGQLPLHRLCTNTELDEATGLEILKLLLEKHPESIRHKTNKGYLPIHFAAFHNVTKSTDFFRVLIEAYPGSERITDDGGMLPLHHACIYNTVAIVKYLYNLYPDAINSKTMQGLYPIHVLIGSFPTVDRADPGAAVDVLKFLLSCDPNAKFQEAVQGESLLHFACKYDNVVVALGIIKAIYDAHPEFIRKEDNGGQLPLHICAFSPSQDETTAMEIMMLLLAKYPESIRHVEKDGYLPIHFATMFKSHEFCRVLIEAYPGSERITGHMDMLPLHCACIKNSVATVEYLYNLYPDAINHATSNGLYPIHATIGTLTKGGGHPNPGAAVEVVKFLLHRDPNIKFQEVQGRSLLAYAVSFDYEENNEAALEIIEAICDAHPATLRLRHL